MKRQRTNWIWLAQYNKSTYIRVGWIHNKSKGVKDDKIRVQIHGLHTDLDFNMRIDEAMGMVAGIGKVMCLKSLDGTINWID